MEFVAFGMMEFLVLLASAYSSPTHDLVSLIRTEDYFRSRNVVINAADMVKLAEKEPADGKAQVQQLLALRWLGEHPDAVKKTDGARAALEQIAAGKKAQDGSGFAKLYARQALARLDGKPLPVAATAPAKSLPGEAFAWFPAESNMVVGMELRSPQATLRAADDPIGQLLMKTIRGPDREELFRTAEAIGNVRLDRLALGMTVDDNANSAQVVFRITGAADRKRIADFFGQVLPGAKVKQEKGPKGEPITLIEGGGKGRPSFALVGDSDLVLVAQADRGPADVLGQVLEVRAGKRKGVPDGKLARLTKEAPRNARTLVAYDLPEKALAKVFRGIAPLPAAPRDLLVYVTKGDATDVTKAGKLSIHFRGRMKDADEAKAFADAAGKLKQEGLKALDNVPPREKVPPAIIKTMKDTLSALKIEARRGSVNGELTIANESALVDAFKWLLEKRAEPPPPPEKTPPPR